MQVEQYVMAYGIEQDRIRAIIPEGFVSLGPVLRINAEIQDNSNGYLEFNIPVEKDNAGCYFLKETPELKKPETITENKEFCDCTFQWKFTEKDAHGVSIGKNLPAYPQEPETTYPRDTFTAENAAKIPCRQVLGTYKVIFER